MLYVDILGYVAGGLIFISLLPQAIKSWTTHSTKDLSLLRYLIYVVGLVLWITYAILIKNGPVFILNVLGIIVAISILYAKLKYG